MTILVSLIQLSFLLLLLQQLLLLLLLLPLLMVLRIINIKLIEYNSVEGDRHRAPDKYANERNRKVDSAQVTFSRRDA